MTATCCIWAYWYRYNTGQRKWHLMTRNGKSFCEREQELAKKFAEVGPVFKLYEGKVRNHP